MRQKILIGGLSLFGSGSYLREYAESRAFDRLYDYNATGFSFIWTLLKSVRHLFRAEVHFQPAICFPAFARDVLIVILLRVLACKVVFVVLSELHYRNPVLNTSLGRRIFFLGSLIISSAPLSGNRYRLPSEVRSPKLNSEDLPKAEISSSGAVLHLGYLSEIKGFDLFLNQSLLSQRRFVAIGAVLGDDQPTHGTVEVSVTKNRDDFFETLADFLKIHQVNCFLFCSRYDLSPLLLLELRNACIPLVALKGSSGARILANFLQPECYCLVDEVSDLDDERLANALSAAAEALAASHSPTMQKLGEK